MTQLSEQIQSADWKTEKHVPTIDCPDTIDRGKPFDVTVTLGKEIAHPNTTEHHIRWLSLYFVPEGQKVPYQVGHFELHGHGESPKGPNEGPVYTGHSVMARVTLNTSGTLHALAHCNIHGLWENTREVTAR
jgi:superoxide reductase